MSRVPQRSYLEPLLFDLFMNDSPAKLKHSQALMYVDNLKLFKKITNVSDGRKLQHFDVLFLWCKENNLSLNLQKCLQIRITVTIRQSPILTISRTSRRSTNIFHVPIYRVKLLRL